MVLQAGQPPQDPKAEFVEFFNNYEDSPNHFKYRDEIQSAALRKQNHIYVLYEHIMAHHPPLAELLREEPEEALKQAVEAFKERLRFYKGGKLEDGEYFVRITTNNGSNEVNLRKLRAEHIDKLVYIYGILIRASQIIPQITEAHFLCPVCQTQIIVDQIETNLIVPKQCTNCKNKSGFIVTSRDSKFIDWQSIQIQELPEELQAGRVPNSLKGILTHDLVDIARPGDRVKITGIFKTYVNDNSRGKKSTLFTPYLRILSVESRNSEQEDLNISAEDEKEILRYAAKPNIQEIIAKSVAPSILGMDHLKMASALALFGGVRKEFEDKSARRGDIHILFVGDPGTGKSQILKQCANISPQAIYASGKGSSAAGLTAAVVRENDAAGLSLEAGALVLADGGNAIIDEFDKMDNRDRVAIHEAMEQQSYHPTTEILSTNGERIQIGKFVDDIIEQHQLEVIHGIDCEIFPTSELGIFSSDFSQTYKTRISRVSRHKSPEYFFKIKFSNGRNIIVTPEHPMYVFKNGNIQTIPADNCSVGNYIPAPKILPNSSESLELMNLSTEPDSRAKEIITPRKLDQYLARIIGFHITEGHSYWGSTAEIGFSNLNKALIEEVKFLYEREFDITPTISTRNSDGLITLRFLSVELFKWFNLNFGEIMTTARNKRIPSKIMQASKNIATNFLQKAFKGDGSVESTSLCYRTSSKGLSRDYQDLLLKIGIQSRIVHDVHNDSFKVYIRGHSLKIFFDIIIEKDDIRFSKILKLIEKSVGKNRHHDTLPTAIIPKLLQLKKELALSDDGYFYQHLKNHYGVTRDIFAKYLNEVQSKYNSIISLISTPIRELRTFRDLSGISQNQIAKICGLTRGTIDYFEKGGYEEERRKSTLKEINEKLKENFASINNKIKILRDFCNTEIFWEKITHIQKIPNQGELYTPWVYDVTVEPNHTFISQGIILHNTVSVAKAGIIATLRARTSIIAAANPKMGRYSEYKTPSENINLSPPILSRFDLIFVVKDTPDEAFDKKMAEFILDLNTQGSPAGSASNKDPLIPGDLLRKYIKYARSKFKPKLTPDARKVIGDFYVDWRKKNSGDENAAVAVVARNLEGYIRIAEAYAKMALRNFVTKDDAENVLKLAEKSMEETTIDPETGAYDADRVFTGISRNTQKITGFLDELKKKIEANKWQPIDEVQFIDDFEFEKGIEKSKLETLLNKLKEQGELYNPTPGKLNFVPSQDKNKKK